MYPLLPFHSNRQKRSLIWKFMVVNEDDPTAHNCTLCNKIIAANSNTTNSKRHMETEHASIWERAQERKNANGANDELEARESDSQSSSSHVDEPDDLETDQDNRNQVVAKPTRMKQVKVKKLLLKRRRVYGKNHAKKLKLDEDVGRLVAENFEPYSIVERPAFLRYSHRLDSRYVPPSRNTVAKKIVPNLFNTVEEKLIARLAGARSEKFYIWIFHSSITTIIQLQFYYFVCT